jgi:hypothetical protein
LVGNLEALKPLTEIPMKAALLLTLLCVSSLAFAQQPQQQQQRPQPPREQGGGGGDGGGRGGPPPEALEACKGKKDGDTVQIKTPHGDKLSATCRMVAVPARPVGDNKGPPPQR